MYKTNPEQQSLGKKTIKFSNHIFQKQLTNTAVGPAEPRKPVEIQHPQV